MLDKDLDYIASSYAQLRLHGSPLKQVNLNSPIKRPPSKTSTPAVHVDSESPESVQRLCMSAIDLALRRFATIKTLTSTHMRLASASFTQLYKTDLQSLGSAVTKKHQQFIMKLLELEGSLHTDFSRTLEEIERAEHPYTGANTDIFDFTEASNPTLTFFTLQTVFKMFQRGDYTYSDKVTKFFLEDGLFRCSLSDAQKNMLVKIVLSMTRISPTPQFKQCMNIKFLEYLHLFQLRFEDFISNMCREAFIADVGSSILAMTQYGCIPAFVHSYVSTDRSDTFSELVQKFRTVITGVSYDLDWSLVSVDTSSSTAVIRLLNMTNVNAELIRRELLGMNRPSRDLMDALSTYFVERVKKKQKVDEEMFLFFVDHVTELGTSANTTLDHVLMSMTGSDYASNFLEDAIMKLQDLYTRFCDFKRLRNLSNLAFQLKLYPHSLIMERTLFVRNGMSSDLGYKFRKALHKLSKYKMSQLQLIEIIFNNSFMDSLCHSRLLEKLDLLEKNFGSKLLFANLMSFPVSGLSAENRALVFILASKFSSDDLHPFFRKLTLTDPVLQMLCGVYIQDIPVVKINQPSTSTVSNVDPLIKCFYYLILERRTKSTLNLRKISQLYLASWVAKNRFPLTTFEAQFLKKFVQYLKFVGFHKCLKTLLDAVDQYRGRGDADLCDWLTFEQLDNALNMRHITKISADVFDAFEKEIPHRDFEVVSDTLLRVLPFQLLQLKYHTVNFDQKMIDVVALTIDESMSLHSHLFSTDNRNGFSRNKFTDILILLLDLHYSRAKLMWAKGHHLECIVSSVCVIQLSKSIVRSDPANLQVLRKMSSSFRNLINTLIHLGITKDADYYIGEFLRFNDTISHYKTLHSQNNYFVMYYLYVSGRHEECQKLKVSTDETFLTLQLIGKDGTNDRYIDNYKLIYYRLLSDIYLDNDEANLEARTNLRSFLTFVDKEGELSASTWKLHYEYHFNSAVVDLTLNRSQNPYLRAMNFMLNSRRLFINAQNSLNMDPLFSTLEDSAMSIPATITRDESPPSPPPVQSKNKPKSLKNVKRAIIGMRQSRSMVLDLFSELQYLANYQRNELHRVLCLNLLTLSSISNNTYTGDSVEKCLMLNNHVKGQPIESERFMVGVTRNSPKLIPSFNFDGLSPKVHFEEVDLELVRKNNWQVLSIDVSTINDELIISRLDDKPKILKLPLTRLSVRTGDENEFKLSDCLNELQSIIGESDKTMRTETTDAIESSEERKQWHATRAELDDKLYNLLCRIEHYWIGGFTSIFNPLKVSDEDFRDFKVRFMNIIRVNIPSRSQKSQAHGHKNVEIDDFIVELFLKLGDPSKLMTTEPLEDLIYFVLDILLFHGEENAYDEVDIDNIYVQIETLLGEFMANNTEPVTYRHTVLLLGKELMKIPWENLPCLRGLSISRIPSLSLLVNLLKSHEELSISKTHGSIVMNPGGDLKKTEERFGESLTHLRDDLEWDTLMGKKPTEAELEKSLQSNLFVYVGHGAGTAYIRETTIKGMEKICPTLLLGCSSAALRSNKQLEPNGTIYSYLIGGCPMVVGNLWDVTDKDIDKFSLSVFQKWGLAKAPGESMNICEAVSRSREECKLKYLNGAAPVVYGLPLTLEQ